MLFTRVSIQQILVSASSRPDNMKMLRMQKNKRVSAQEALSDWGGVRGPQWEGPGPLQSWDMGKFEEIAVLSYEPDL